jgi:glycosyltransferase involved in cell wall biosynthesis
MVFSENILDEYKEGKMQATTTNPIPLVSIGICTYNRTRTFRRALESVINQTYSNLEIIIGDNSDNEETKTVIETWYVSDIRIKYYKHPRNIGMAKNGIFVRGKAKGKYFLYVNDDDYWDTTFIEKAVSKLESDNDAVACWSKFLYIGKGGDLDESGEFDNQDLSSDDIVDNLVRYNMQPGWYEFHALYRFEILNRFDLSQYKTTGADVILTNLVLLSGKCLFIDEPLFFYSPSPKSAFERYRDSEIFNEYAQINPHLDLFIKIFLEIFRTKKLSFVQKMLFYIKFWYQIFFKNHTWIYRFHLYPQKKFFKLVAKKKFFLCFLICFPFFIYRIILLVKEKIFSKLRNAKASLSFFIFLMRRRKKNTVLLIEPHHYHQEVVPGYVKYFVDLGYKVDVIMLPETKRDNVFCRYQNSNIYLYTFTLKMMVKFISLKRIQNYVAILITTYYPADYQNLKSYERMFYDTLFLSTHTKFFCVHDLPCDISPVENTFFIVLKDFFSVSYKPLMVNPHFFGEPKIFPKNEVTNFIVVGNKEMARSNYDLLTDTCGKLINRHIIDFHITLFGAGDIAIKQSLKNCFTVLGYVDFSSLFQYLEQADFILALLDPENLEHEVYVNRKSTGTFQLCYGFLKPVILCRKFITGTGFTDANALIYDDNAMFESTLQEAISMDRITYANLRDNLTVLEKDIARRSLINLQSYMSSPPREIIFTVAALGRSQFFKNERIAA